MAITVEEKPESRDVSTGDRATAILRFDVLGTADDYAAWIALGNEAPSTWHGLVRTRHDVHARFVDETQPDASLWEGVVHYGRRRLQPDTNQSTFSFDTGGGTQHITNSIATVGYYGDPAESFITDHLGAIGWDGQTVRGVDITVPVYHFSETHYLPIIYVTEAYKRQLRDLTGKLNGGVFRLFAPGEVLFLRAEGKQRSSEDWAITFYFAACENRTDIEVGRGLIQNIAKKGWEYLWVQYHPAAGADKDNPAQETGDLIPKPKAVFIEQVYYYRDFSRLGIGT